MSQENLEKAVETEDLCCKEHAVDADVKPSSTLSASSQREHDRKEHYSLTRETRDTTKDDKDVYIISREDSIIKEVFEPLIAEQAHLHDYALDEYCELHAQELNASTQDTFDILDDGFSFATEIVSTAIDNLPDFNLIPSIIDICLKTIIYLKTNPKFTSIIVSLLVVWWVWCQIDFYYSFLIAYLVNILNPCVHYIAVTLEQIFRRGFELSSSLQEVWESFHCDFSTKWCKNFDLMCEVQCSHVHRTLERIRRTF